MKPRIFSSCHSLKLFPVPELSKFAVYNNRVRMAARTSPFVVPATPGTIKVSNTVEDGISNVTITFSQAANDVADVDILKIMSSLRLVATYIDEAGNGRVVGSPDYPLSLEVNEARGVIVGTLSGHSKSIPLFL